VTRNGSQSQIPDPQEQPRLVPTDKVAIASDLPHVDFVAHIAPEVLPAVALHLAALQAAVAARLACGSSRDHGADRLLTVKEAAPVLGMSEDWLYRNADRLPFTRRTGSRAVRFSERSLKRYIADRDA
jgi:excisionase family DNA binding protein